MRKLGGKAVPAGALALLTALVAGPALVRAAEEPRDLLPDLRPRPQKHVTLDAFGIHGGQTVNGCLADEMVEDAARRCLRFDQSIANLGDGPFELRYDPPSYLLDPFMYQRIRRSDGSWRERQAEEYELHPTHAHFHYKGFGFSRLWRAEESGARLGSEPVRSGRKNGFCVMDIEKIRSGAPDSQYDGSGCTASDDYKNGITQGWADTYSADLPDQYIEISGVPDGYYELETLADPDGTVLESNEANNSGSILIRLEGDTVQAVRVLHDPTVEPAPAPAATVLPAPPPPPQPAPTPAPAAGGGGSAAPAAKPARRRKAKRSCRKPSKKAGARRRAASKRASRRTCRRKRR